MGIGDGQLNAMVPAPLGTNTKMFDNDFFTLKGACQEN